MIKYEFVECVHILQILLIRTVDHQALDQALVVMAKRKLQQASNGSPIHMWATQYHLICFSEYHQV